MWTNLVINLSIFLIRKYGHKVEFIDEFLDKVDDSTLGDYLIGIESYLEAKAKSI